MLNSIDWQTIFTLGTPLPEIFIRGSLTYLGLFVMLRVVLKRQTGGVSITDMLVIVLIADAAQNAMADDYRSVPDGLLLVATIIFWCYAIDWLGYRFPSVRRWLEPAPLPLIRNGIILRRNLRQELITLEELHAHMREAGVQDIRQVKFACMEADGHISVIPRE